MKGTYILCLLSWGASLFAQNQTDVSLYMKSEADICLDSVKSKTGNMFHALGHHGPAVENQWIGLRLYFNKKAAIDVYSKANPGLEIREKKWYPSNAEQKAGWGADYYKVGKTVGLGGVRLWDGKKVIPLHPVSSRSARVVTRGDLSFMEMLSEGVPYRGKLVDILVRVTVFTDRREAKVEAFSQTGDPVQFVSGINYFESLTVHKQDQYILSWGIHPEDVAADKVEVGAAIMFHKSDFEKHMDDGKQHLIISKPTRSIETWISSANAREKEVNTLARFIKEVEGAGSGL
jgi:hypothetical protein